MHCSRSACTGFTLIEMAIGLAFAGLVLGGIWVTYDATREGVRVMDAARQIAHIASEMRNRMESGIGFGGTQQEGRNPDGTPRFYPNGDPVLLPCYNLSDQQALKYVPADTIVEDATGVPRLQNPWKGRIKLGWVDNFVIIGVSSVPYRSCARLINSITGYNLVVIRRQRSVTINGSDAPSPGTCLRGANMYSPYAALPAPGYRTSATRACDLETQRDLSNPVLSEGRLSIYFHFGQTNNLPPIDAMNSAVADP